MVDHDWNALKNQFIQSNLSFTAFCKKNKVSTCAAGVHAKRELWFQLRNRFQNKVSAEIEKKAVRDYAKTWITLENTWDGMLLHVRAHLKPIEDVNGTLRPVGVETLTKLANVLDHITKNLRLLAGESTENTRDLIDPEIQVLKDDPRKLNDAIAREMAEIAKLQKLTKAKIRR